MDLYDVMRTTFAARDFTDEPVSDATLARILDNARFAPSGGNRQGWKVVVVRDDGTRARLGELIEPGFRSYVAQVQAGEAPWNTINASAVSDEQVAATTLPPIFRGSSPTSPFMSSTSLAATRCPGKGVPG